MLLQISQLVWTKTKQRSCPFSNLPIQYQQTNKSTNSVITTFLLSHPYSTTYLPLIIEIHLQYVLDNVLEVPLLHTKPSRDAGHITCTRDGRQLPGEVYRKLPVGQYGGLTAGGHIAHKLLPEAVALVGKN